MTLVPISRPIRVITSCDRVEQLNAAQLYAVRWLNAHGMSKESVHARVLFAFAALQLELLVRGPGSDVLEPAHSNHPCKGHGDEQREEAREDK